MALPASGEYVVPGALVPVTIDRDLLAEVAWPADEGPLVYVCGPTPFVETAASSFVTDAFRATNHNI